jgi:general secretion pathway protein D
MKYFQKFFVVGVVIFLGGCIQTPEEAAEEKYQINDSFIKGVNETTTNKGALTEPDFIENESGFETLASLSRRGAVVNNTDQLSRKFSNTEKAKFAANNMPVVEFVHYAFGEILGANYVIGNDLKVDQTQLTLNVQSPLSKRELFTLIAKTLQRYQVNIDFDSDVFFVNKATLSKAKAVIGIGSVASSVPNSSNQILQVIPIKYGIKISVERTLNQLIEAKVTPDFEQGALFVLGDRANVLRAIELVNLLDVPANRSKNIGLLSLKYISTQEFLDKTVILMNNEGLPIGVNQESNKNILLVPIEHIGSVAVFATSEELLNRVRYWASVMDKPSRGENQQFFVYNPTYARASDLGASIAGLLALGSGVQSIQTNENSTGSNADELASQQSPIAQAVNGRDISFVVDERSNSIIFSTSGSKYQTLLPLLEKLDVLPKQVLLEIVIAEVTLEGTFQYGVEFAIRNSSDVTISNLSESVGPGLFLGSGSVDTNQILSAFSQSSSFVNTLSNPSILVRDGVSASINVGSDIPTVGGTVTDGLNGVTQNIVYRQTGVNATVTPTVNAQGVVIMNIDLQISNEVIVDGESPDTPAIFERALTTEVVVQSGQTVLLGGLISENDTNGENKVPLLGDIPLLGKLFKSQNQQKEKTELVLVVTPKVIERNDEWEKLLKDFQNGLENIQIIK